MKTLSSMIACLFLIVLQPLEAEACSCAPPTSELMNEADVVFVGEVVSVDPPDAPRSEGSRVAVLTVAEQFKNAAAEMFLVYTSMSSATCGVDFRVGQHYLVFAYEDEGRLGTGLCSTLDADSSLGRELLEVLRTQ